jgi:3-phenylpropionate/trans-cinnamate dioxygenase ferredoxin subunit
MKLKAAKSKDVETNRPHATQVNGQKVLLLRTGEGLFAIENSCPHQSQSLEYGKLEGKLLTCRYHGIRIDVSTGAVVWAAGYIGMEPVKTFEVEERDGIISVEMA